MPTKTYYRHWCKNCEEFTLHLPEDEELYCIECDTKYTQIYISEIPEDKIEEQRERYKQYRKRKMQNFLANTMSLGQIEIPPQQIIESDVGLEREEKVEREKKERIIQNMKDQIEKYKNVGRNDICLCGSGKKYKKCCLSKIQDYKRVIR